MARQIEADGGKFFAQALVHRPIVGGNQRQAVARGRAEQARLPLLAVAHGARGAGEYEIGRLEELAAVAMERIKRAGFDEAFEGALVDEPRIDAAGEIGDGTERSTCPTERDDMIHRLAADILHRGQRVIDDAARDACIAGEGGPATIDLGRADLDAEAGRFLAEDVETMRVADV